jgi:hypothetical protein
MLGGCFGLYLAGGLLGLYHVGGLHVLMQIDDHFELFPCDVRSEVRFE